VAVLACPAGGWGVHCSTATLPTTHTRGRASTQHDRDTDHTRTQLGHGTHRLPKEGRTTLNTVPATPSTGRTTPITVPAITRSRAPTQHELDTDPVRTQVGYGTRRLPKEGRITPCFLIATARVPCVTPSRVQDTAVLGVTLVTPTRGPNTLAHRADTATPLCRVPWVMSGRCSSTSRGQGSACGEPCTGSLCCLSTPCRTGKSASWSCCHGGKKRHTKSNRAKMKCVMLAEIVYL
jgi:hypothetical protein